MLTSGAYGYLADYLLWIVLYASLLVHTCCFFKFFPRQRRPRLRLVLGNALVTVCLLGLVTLLAESYLRFVSVRTEPFGVTLPARRWFALYTELNSLGCRDVEWTPPKPDGVRRIMFVGDSFVYGWGIKRPEDRFPDRIQARFDQRTPGAVEVMNVAKPGWDTGQQLQPIRDMIELYGVDEVVLGYVANDVEKLLPVTDDFNPTKPPQCRFFNTDSSCLIEFLYHRLIVPQAPTVRGFHEWLMRGYSDEELWRRQQQRLGAIINHCQARGVTLRVVLLPFIQIDGERFDSAGVHGQVRRFFELNGIEVVDLLPVIATHEPKTLVVNRADAHPNELAQRLFAQRIWEAFYAKPTPESGSPGQFPHRVP